MPLEDRYLHVKRVNSLNPFQLACAKEVAAWRESEAKKRNTPRRWVLSDEFLIEICKLEPKKIDEIFKIRGAKHSIGVSDARKIIECVNRAKKYSEDDLLKLKDKHKHVRSEISTNDIDCQMDLMSAIVRLRAKENNIASQTLSSNNDLNKIAHGAKSGIPTLSGWRKKIVGNELLDLIDGKISLFIDGGTVKVKNSDDLARGCK